VPAVLVVDGAVGRGAVVRSVKGTTALLGGVSGFDDSVVVDTAGSSGGTTGVITGAVDSVLLSSLVNVEVPIIPPVESSRICWMSATVVVTDVSTTCRCWMTLCI
jgi:hypothetical protein